VNAEGSYDPSSFTIKMATQAKSDYKAQEWSEKYTGDKPILVVATDEGQLTMKNGKVFNTGNHPIEMLVPMLHFRDAGFSFDFATARGEPVVLEMWAFPHKDENVKRMQEEVSAMMKAPKKLESIESLDGYAAIFVPGGHGCMINLPSSAALGRLLNEAHDKQLPTVTLCHGPAAYLSTSLEAAGRTECAYKGYKTMCFTDKTDAFTPKVGYLPGPMPWKVQACIEAQGVQVVNTSEKGDVLVDRELISGDSPAAANKLGIVAAPLIVKKHSSILYSARGAE
jgi:molecular chaperone Hsp31 and glyoxalase 3